MINDTAQPQIFFACGGRLLIRIDPSHGAQQSPPQHPPLPILVALLERNLQAKQFSQIASSSNKRIQLVALLRCDELIGIAEVHIHAKHRHDLEAEHIATASSALPSACRARRFAAAALRHA